MGLAVVLLLMVWVCHRKCSSLEKGCAAIYGTADTAERRQQWRKEMLLLDRHVGYVQQVAKGLLVLMGSEFLAGKLRTGLSTPGYPLRAYLTSAKTLSELVCSVLASLWLQVCLQWWC